MKAGAKVELVEFFASDSDHKLAARDAIAECIYRICQTHKITDFAEAKNCLSAVCIFDKAKNIETGAIEYGYWVSIVASGSLVPKLIRFAFPSKGFQPKKLEDFQ